MKLFYCALIAASVVLPASFVSAGIFDTVDGTINLGEYSVGTTDDYPESTTFFNTGIDIDRVEFRVANVDATDMLYFGFNVTNGTFDVGSPLNRTRVMLDIYKSDFSAAYKIELIFNGSAIPANVSLINLLTFVEINVPLGDTSVITGPDFEAGIKAAYLSDVITPNSSQVDFDYTLYTNKVRGQSQGDQVSDSISVIAPEPATIALFAAGTALMATRKRKHA